MSALGDRLALSLRPRLERFMLPLSAFIASVSALLFPAQGNCAGAAAAAAAVEAWGLCLEAPIAALSDAHDAIGARAGTVS